MSRVFINYGHGGNDFGAIGNGLFEKDLTKEIGSKIVKQLKENYHVTVKGFQQGHTGNGLRQITNEANKFKPDLFVSIHINAGGGTGFESFIFNGSVLKATKNSQKVLHDSIMKAIKKYNVRDRGKKRANFHVLRETNCPAILTETLFIDHKTDSKLLRDSDFIDDVVKGHVDGIVRVLGLKKKVKKEVSTKGETFYRVVTGSFKNKKNADQRVKELTEKGFESFIDIYKK